MSSRSILIALVLASSPLVAHAGHYRLPVDNLVTVDESNALSKAGIRTTLGLLDHVAPLDKRRALAAKSGLTFVRLSTLATQIDLLRVEGVGPSMVRLLQAAGIRHTRDLGAADAAGLREKMRVANGVHQISSVLPQEDVVRSWIESARGLPQILEGVQ
ncbi:MAG: DUF4332 domain-containing protein [Deltaproteobacteria bacterium]|nr:DUF4332 domain-containing protein [Deltaproteobacteria bacterium]